jgi:hypothetical protein
MMNRSSRAGNKDLREEGESVGHRRPPGVTRRGSFYPRWNKIPRFRTIGVRAYMTLKPFVYPRTSCQASPLREARARATVGPGLRLGDLDRFGPDPIAFCFEYESVLPVLKLSRLLVHLRYCRISQR